MLFLRILEFSIFGHFFKSQLQLAYVMICADGPGIANPLLRVIGMVI